MNVTYAEIAAKLLNQLERGWITYSSYVSEMERAYNNERLRVADTRKEWVVVELSTARGNEPRYFATEYDAKQKIDDYKSSYGIVVSTRRSTTVDGKQVVSFKDEDGDVATFIIYKRTI